MSENLDQQDPVDVIGSYRLDEYVITDALGELYRGHHTIRDVPITVRVTRAMKDPLLLRRMHENVSRMWFRPTEHWCLPRVIDHQIIGNGLAIAYEWCSGSPISSLLETGGISLDTAAWIMEQVAVGLAAAPDIVGLPCHGALSTTSIWTDGNSVQILDWGIGPEILDETLIVSQLQSSTVRPDRDSFSYWPASPDDDRYALAAIFGMMMQPWGDEPRFGAGVGEDTESLQVADSYAPYMSDVRASPSIPTYADASPAPEIYASAAPLPTQHSDSDAASHDLPLEAADANVFLGITAPSSAGRDDEFTARFFAYTSDEREATNALLERWHDTSEIYQDLDMQTWKPGTEVTVHVSGRGLEVDPGVRSFFWQGKRIILDFGVLITPSAKAKAVLRFDVMIEGILVAAFRHELQIMPERGIGEETGSSGVAARSAFASYASPDRDRVIDRVSALRSVANMDVFLDHMDLTTGEKWKDRLRSEIMARDVFLLFWSQRAVESPWVSWEWRTALENRGLDIILPQPLESVEHAPVPEELAALHFGDRYLALRKRIDHDVRTQP